VTTRISRPARRNSTQPLPCAGADEIRTHLEKILAGRLFSRSDRLIRFLRFSVEQTLAGKGDQLKEQLIGIEVFDRKPDYDPRIDPIVRVEARRLRSKLKAYYASVGRADRILIGLPKGSYAPFFRSRTTAAPVVRKETAERSIVVLPFTNLTPEAGDDYFSDGLTEELIHLLTRIPKLRVVAWDSASQLRGREQDLAGIRQQLNVGAVLRGSVRRTCARVRVTSQLIDAETGAYLWSHAYDSEMQDVFTIQEEIARAIVDTLQLTLKSEAGRKAPNLNCYNLCLQARFHTSKRTMDGLRKSITCFEQAIAADDSSAAAYAGLADSYSLLAHHGLIDTAEAISKARAAAEKALALDPQSPEATVSLAFIRGQFDWDWVDAESLYRRAIALNPGYSRARHWFAVDHLALLGRLDEALAEIHIACHLDPLSQIIHEGYGYVYMFRREYSTALEKYQQLIDLDPLFYKGYSSMGRVLCLMGRFDEAIAMLEKARILGGAVPSILSALGQTLAVSGRVEEARSYLDELHSLAKTRCIPRVCFAILFLGLGDRQTALRYLDEACERREMSLTALKVHPIYDPLRSEPHFNRILQRVHLLP
jgi:TolB-like protein/tetratricopeptide (TPR) repeat protein